MTQRTRTVPWLAAILALAVLLRTAVAGYLGDVVDAPPQLTDQRSYHALAERLLGGHGFSFAVGWYPFTPANTPTAHWSFLEALYVAGVYAAAGVHPLAARLTTALLGGLLLPLAVYALARRALPDAQPLVLRLGRRQFIVAQPSALLAALLAALYPYYLLYGATLMTETFFITALVWSLERSLALAAILRRDGDHPPSRQLVGSAAVTLGLALAVATLFRQSILPWIPVLALWVVGSGWAARRRLIPSITALALAGAVVAAAVLPFTVRNWQVYGQFLLLNSNAGYALYSAQHPMQGVEFREFDAAPVPPELAGRNEAELDRELLRRGVGFVLADPVRYLRLSLSRVKTFFEFWPKPATTLLHNIGRVASFGLLLPCALAGIWLALARSPERQAQRWLRLLTTPLALLLLFVLCYSLLHILTWAIPRYRLPVDAVLLLFAAGALVQGWRRLAAGGGSQPRPALSASQGDPPA